MRSDWPREGERAHNLWRFVHGNIFWAHYRSKYERIINCITKQQNGFLLSVSIGLPNCCLLWFQRRVRRDVAFAHGFYEEALPPPLIPKGQTTQQTWMFTSKSLIMLRAWILISQSFPYLFTFLSAVLAQIDYKFRKFLDNLHILPSTTFPTTSTRRYQLQQHGFLHIYLPRWCNSTPVW